MNIVLIFNQLLFLNNIKKLEETLTKVSYYCYYYSTTAIIVFMIIIIIIIFDNEPGLKIFFHYMTKKCTLSINKLKTYQK